MNKETAPEIVERAIHMALIERVMGKKVDDFEWFKVRLAQEKQKNLSGYLGGLAASVIREA